MFFMQVATMLVLLAVLNKKADVCGMSSRNFEGKTC